MDLEKQVHEALDNAVKNEQGDFCSGPSDIIAADLIAYDADLENRTIQELVPHIDTWKNSRM